MAGSSRSLGEATAQTAAMMNAEMLSYSRSRGLFVGISLQGATLRPDEESNKVLYGRDSTNREILAGDFKTPAIVRSFERALRRESPTNSNEISSSFFRRNGPKHNW